uniref:Protein kinase domain-containing protein n=1 Tax=Knipowitschia caucasica TaxID=637954 RepID=A0AAV2JLB5_KNICA
MKWLRDLVKVGGSISSNFSSYQLQKILGSGCFSTVALCTKNNTDQKVALKVVKHPDREANFMRYLSKSGSASHHLVQWFCSFDFNAHFCHEFEVLDIGLDKSSTLPLHHIRPIITQMADALTFLKSLKIIHGDLNLENMLVDHVRKPLQVKLIDFGQARLAKLATQGTCFGALCYSLESQLSVSPCLSKPRGQKRKREDEDDEEDVEKRPEKRYRGKGVLYVLLESDRIQLPSSLPETPEVSRPRGQKRKREDGKEEKNVLTNVTEEQIWFDQVKKEVDTTASSCKGS